MHSRGPLQTLWKLCELWLTDVWSSVWSDDHLSAGSRGLVTVRGPGRISTSQRCSLLLSVSESLPPAPKPTGICPRSLSGSLHFTICLWSISDGMSSQSQYRRKLFQCLMFAIFSAPLRLSPLTQCLQLRILCSDSASALCSVKASTNLLNCHSARRRSLYYSFHGSLLTKPTISYDLCRQASYFYV